MGRPIVLEPALRSVSPTRVPGVWWTHRDALLQPLIIVVLFHLDLDTSTNSLALRPQHDLPESLVVYPKYRPKNLIPLDQLTQRESEYLTRDPDVDGIDRLCVIVRRADRRSEEGILRRGSREDIDNRGMSMLLSDLVVQLPQRTISNQ